MYQFSGCTCLNNSMRDKIDYLSQINLDHDEINAFYTLIKETLLPVLEWKVSGRCYPRRRGTCQYHRDGLTGQIVKVRILIHRSGEHAECVLHELAHGLVAAKGIMEHHGQNFAEAFEQLIDLAKGVLF